RSTGWSFEELDWALRSIGRSAPGADIDPDAIRRLSRIRRWQDQLGLPLEVLCSFWYDVKHVGRRNPAGPDPQSLADRVFNHPQLLDGAAPYDFASPGVAPTWDRNDPGDPQRGRLLASLEVTDRELDRLGAALPANPVHLSLANLSALYRLSRLPRVLGLAIADFFDLLDLLGIAPDRITDFDALDRVIDTARWHREARWRVQELAYMVTGRAPAGIEPGYGETDVRLWLEDLAAASVRIAPTDFAELDGVSEEQSIAVYRRLVEAQPPLIVVDDGGARGRLTADFAPDAPGFTLGPLVPPFDAAEEAAREREIIALLTRRREEQKGVVLEKLARFFDREPAVVASLLSA